MSQHRKATSALTVIVVAGVIAGAYFMGRSDERAGRSFSLAGSAQAAETPAMSPVKRSTKLDMYFPGTEDLAANEMRIVACGTGMPAQRKSQAATCWLVELGNGDKFLFDIGTGSSANLGSLNIPYDYLNKVFLSHLHSDHIGDMDALWIGGWTGGRQGALHVWGPNGDKPETGTKYAMDHLKKAYTWDYTGRLGVIPTGGGALEVTEFDYKKINQVVYKKNGVTIYSWPAIHCIDGAVSYRLEWNGLTFVFGGDTVPNKWYVDQTKGADLAIHESFMTPQQMMEKYKFSAQAALNVATAVHTPPAAFGKVMAAVQPRMAVAYHFFNDFDTRYAINDGIRSTYDGPLTMATDLLVWNITKDDMRLREVIVDPESWPAPPASKPGEPDESAKTPFSDFVNGGRLNVSKAFAKEIAKFKKENGLK